MQETLHELQVLRAEDEDLRRQLDALKGEESVYSAAISADSSHKSPGVCGHQCGKRREDCGPRCFVLEFPGGSLWLEFTLFHVSVICLIVASASWCSL